MRRPAVSFTVLVSALLAGCASFPPEPAARALGYEGPSRPESEVATVFILDGRPHFESGYICQVDGRPATKDGGCASIIYLLPGRHRLSIKYRSHVETGEGAIDLAVEAGRLYQLNATSFRSGGKGRISVIPMAPGLKLTYRNVAPGQFAGAKADEAVPYGGQ